MRASGPAWRYTIDTATGGVEKQQMDGAFAPTWYDDAALYQENRSNLWVESLTRLDRTTGEVTLQNLPGQTYTVCGSVDGCWLLVARQQPVSYAGSDQREGRFRRHLAELHGGNYPVRARQR